MIVSIIGASGYTGNELMRILANHNKIEEIRPYSRTYSGKKVSDLNKNLTGFEDKFEKFSELDVDAIDTEICFLCTPNGEAMKIVPKLHEKGIKTIDLSADYRLPQDVYENTYKIKHESPELIDKAVYGLPELFREKIRNAEIIANPGCYATSAILAIAPLKEFKDLIDREKIIVDAKSGTSGAGKKVEEYYIHSEIHDNIKPYNVTFHRHRPEIENVLKNFLDCKISFTPTLLPVIRGIITNVHIFSDRKIDSEHYKKFYEKEYFIRIREIAEMKYVLNTNFCDISTHYDEHTKRLVVISTIDNLIKGASGQAVQNMNIMCNFSENEGLNLVSGV